MDSNWLTTNRGPVQKGPIHSVTIPGQVLRPLLVETRSAFSVNMHTRRNLPRRVSRRILKRVIIIIKKTGENPLVACPLILWIDAAAVEFVVVEWAKEELAVTEVEWPQPPRAPPPPPLLVRLALL